MLFLLLLAPACARAGAWTEPENHWQVIVTALASEAGRSFDHAGDPSVPIRFEKAVLQTSAEYGWTDWLTIFLNGETVFARSQQAPLPVQQAVDNAFEAGGRLRLADDIGIVSLQASVKSAGAFNFSVSANSNVAGQQAELRLLYGTGFVFDGDNGFLDIEAGERFLSAPRPSETPIDMTAGLWLTSDDLALLQSFNLVSGGNGAPPYGYTRSHKLQASWVRRVAPGWLVQLGGFVSPFGQNALVERGFCLALWVQF